MKAILRTAALTAVLTASAGFASTAAAQESETFLFRVDASTLVDEASIRRTYQRLESEATRYCRALNLDSMRARASCRIDVVAHVVEAVGHDGLIALHRERTREGRMIAGTGGR